MCSALRADVAVVVVDDDIVGHDADDDVTVDCTVVVRDKPKQKANDITP